MNNIGHHLFYEISRWADKTFGKKRSNRTILLHLEEEVNELAIAVDNCEKNFDTKVAMVQEMADVQILLWNLAARNGVCYDSFMDMCMAKHQVNENRKWVMIDGKMKHIPDNFNIVEP